MAAPGPEVAGSGRDWPHVSMDDTESEERLPRPGRRAQGRSRALIVVASAPQGATSACWALLFLLPPSKSRLGRRQAIRSSSTLVSIGGVRDPGHRSATDRPSKTSRTLGEAAGRG